MFAPPCLLSACGFSCLGVGDVHLEKHLPPVSPPTHRGPLHPSWPHPRCLGSHSKVGPQGSEQLGMGTENENPEPDCQKQFQAAVSIIQNLPKNGSYRPSYKEMLRFYSYYKQATMGPCLVPQPGFWDPIGRYKCLLSPRDAWNSLGKMSREQAMSAYVTEMKLVAQRVIDTVPLGEVAEDMFGYFEPLYQVIPDMPRPPETFLKRVTGWKEQVLNGDAEPAPEPPCLPKEPAPPSPESQPPRDQDSEVFCDSMEQLEPELQVGAEQRGALGGELNTRNSTESPAKKGRLESTLLGPQELDTWLVGTVRALQESMRDVQGRLQSLESMPVPRKQRPRPGTGLSVPTLLFFLLWPFIVQWLFRQFRTQKR
ncbi:acyl-CoA-binding domain-containing protein 4 isoform X2 [Delphinapterus leucas]|uniref:Acyl-CoA-binding domain-containing protein 4 isoform X2 n=1 Tax=Delphinapterus leucas TaxID=9749 RepID=A0A2Y9MFX3_DELLE|nr:acyl-CoA-binding domain-containing protein 4 isoform X2 [Delphinapterus leucas]